MGVVSPRLGPAMVISDWIPTFRFDPMVGIHPSGVAWGTRSSDFDQGKKVIQNNIDFVFIGVFPWCRQVGLVFANGSGPAGCIDRDSGTTGGH